MLTPHLRDYSFKEKPDIRFSIQEKDEEVLLLLRSHPITQLPWILASIGMIVLPWFCASLISYLPLTNSQLIWLVISWYGITLSYILNKFFFWYFNLGLITNIRVMDIDCYNLMNTHTTASLIDKIEQVEKRSLGLFSAWFDYGSIFVQTAGEIPNIEFLDVPQPAKVVQIINTLMEEHATNN